MVRHSCMHTWQKQSAAVLVHWFLWWALWTQNAESPELPKVLPFKFRTAGVQFCMLPLYCQKFCLFQFLHHFIQLHFFQNPPKTKTGVLAWTVAETFTCDLMNCVNALIWPTWLNGHFACVCVGGGGRYYQEWIWHFLISRINQESCSDKTACLYCDKFKPQ